MSVADMANALATQIQTQLCGTASPVIPNLQVDGRMIPNPTTPAIDIYPAETFTESSGYGLGNREYYWTVRARVSVADHEAGQDLLLSMMDADSPTSVELAIRSHDTLGTAAYIHSVEGPTGFSVFPTPGSDGSSLVGCTWQVRMTPQ